MVFEPIGHALGRALQPLMSGLGVEFEIGVDVLSAELLVVRTHRGERHGRVGRAVQEQRRRMIGR